MGAWGYRPWEDDGGADWFGTAFHGTDLDAAIAKAFESHDNCAAIRSACYVLIVLGHSPYTWPGNPDELAGLKERGAELLEAMAKEGSAYRAEWDDSPEILAELQAGIEALRGT